MGKKKIGEPSVLSDKETVKAASREAVHKALNALGSDASIERLGEWIKENVGIEIENRKIGLFKYHLLPKKPRVGGRKPGRPRKDASTWINGSTGKGEAGRQALVAVDDLRLVKELVNRYGHESLRELLDLLGR